MRVACLAATVVLVTACRGPMVWPDANPTDASDIATDVVGDRADVSIDATDVTDAATDAIPSDAQPILAPEAIPERRVACGPRVGTLAVTAGASDRFVLRGRIVTPATVIPAGEVVVASGTISCVDVSCSTDPNATGATVIDTAGVIYPGLVDAHNHVAYDFLPPWTPPHLYRNRYQWERDASYNAFVQPYSDNVAAHECAMTKYGELRAIVAGTTSIEGAPNRTCIHNLARNVEFGWDFGGVDPVRTNILGISTVTGTALTNLQTQMRDGTVTAYIIHLSEGVDETSRAEFDDLVTKMLLTDATVVIHGTAFTPVEAMALGGVGGKLIWSPRSNAILYGRTTDIPSLLDSNTLVALGPDWTLSGGPNLFAEMRYARFVSQTLWGGRITSRDLVEMVTSRPARAVSRDGSIGSIAVGLDADLLVVPDTGCDPYDTLVDAVTADVELVMVGGVPVYGDATVMNAMPTADLANCEPVTFCGVDKTICVSQGPTATNGYDQTLIDIVTEIQGFYPNPYPLVPLCP